MHDLSATMFYKAKFTVSSNDPSVDLLWLLILDIRNWLIKKWNVDNHQIIDSNIKTWSKFKMYGCKIYDEENTYHVYGESARHDNEETGNVSWACKIVEKPDPLEGCAPREWTTEIGYQSVSKTSAVISYVLTYSDMPGFIGFCEKQPIITVPSIIRWLLYDKKITCSIGPDQLKYDPVLLKPEDFPSFEKEVIFNPDREVPIIYISPREIENENFVCQMAKSVAANAIVYYSNEGVFMDKQYGCWGGAIRIYRPKINRDDPNDQYKHRFITASFIQENGEDAVLDIFRRAIAQDVHYYDTMFRLDSCKELRYEDERKKKIKEFRAKSKEVEEVYQQWEEANKQYEEANKAAVDYQNQANRLEGENYNLKAQVDSLRYTAEQARQIEDASQKIRQISKYPDTPHAIAEYFATVYPERIAFTERAKSSMEDVKTKNNLLWKVFYHMAVDLYELLQEISAPSQAYKAFTDKTGLDVALNAGKMTRADNKLMRQYTDSYNGQEINIETHIKKGNKDSDPKSVRVYFCYDSKTCRIIIGHCGGHLDNYTTRKIK